MKVLSHFHQWQRREFDGIDAPPTVLARANEVIE